MTGVSTSINGIFTQNPAEISLAIIMVNKCIRTYITMYMHLLVIILHLSSSSISYYTWIEAKSNGGIPRQNI